MGIRYNFDNCPKCHRASSGKQKEMCDDCYTVHVIGYRISSNGLEFRVEIAVEETVGWWIFKRNVIVWKPVDKNGTIQDFSQPYFYDDLDIEYYETREDAQKALDKFVSNRPETVIPTITRLSNWEPV